MLDFDQELLEGFIQESREHLDSLEPDLLTLETERDNAEVINRIFRAVHTIKGGAGFLGLTKISGLSHTMENMMSLVREGVLPVTKEMTDALLAGTDKLRAMINDPEHSEEADITSELTSLQSLLENQGHAPAKEPAEAAAEPFASKETSDHLSVLKRVDSYFLKDAVETGRSIYLVRLSSHKDIEDKGVTPIDVLKQIESFGEFLDCYTDISQIGGLDDALGVDLIYVFVVSTLLDANSMPVAIEVPKEQIEQIPEADIQKFLAEKEAPAPTPSPTPAQPAPPQPAEPPPPPAQPVQELPPVANVENKITSPTPPPPQPEIDGKDGKQRKKTDETIRVSVSLLDDLMNLAGEMVLGRNQLLRIADQAASSVSGMAPVMQNISLVTSELQERVMQTRLQPSGTVFGKFTRVIRDLSRKMSKEIDLKISGEDVELDKSIIEALSDPLTHLVRNCASHGIESPAGREAAGKRRAGSVQLNASHIGGQVLIEIIDDGKGMDPEKVKRKAVEKGLLRSEEAEKMSDRQAMHLIFLPGFSTTDTVSDVSGRGVGMDVVKTNIEEVGGSVDIDSQIGRGTRVSLRLPLTLAIIPAMIVGVRDRRFAVPQVGLEEIVKLDSNHRMEDVRGVPVMRLRDKLLPLVCLEEILEIEKTLTVKPENEEESSEERAAATEETSPQTHQPWETGQEGILEEEQMNGYVLVLKVENNRYGVIVDELQDSEEIVVKPLSSYLKSAQCYSGATIMGDGKVAMILEPGGIANAADLKFEEIHEEDLMRMEEQLSDVSETQSLLLFRNEESELFAMNLAMISRIEKIKASSIEHLGKKEYLKYRDSSLRLLRLHEFMPIRHPAGDLEYLYVIVPKLVSYPMGIVVTKIEDVIRTSVALDEETVQGTGVLGSAVINEELVVFIDVYGLFEEADPEHYKYEHKAVDLSGKRILLAEDTAFFRAVELQYLKEFACQVDAAVNGIEALEKLNRGEYDLVLTDIEMPGMDGFELTQRIRSSEKLKELPIVALTALSAEQHVNRGKEVGVDAYETKLDKEHLRATLERVLSKGRRIETREVVAAA